MDNKYLYLIIIFSFAIVLFFGFIFLKNQANISGNVVDIFKGSTKEVKIDESKGGGFTGPAPLDRDGLPASCDFYGVLTIGGSPATFGTLVEAKVEDGRVCGSFIVSNPPGEGYYGFLHCACGGEFPSCIGENISFTVNGELADALGPDSTIWEETIKHVNLSKEISCYDYIPGDVNGDGMVIGGDVTYLVNYFLGNVVPDDDFLFGEDDFWASADVTGDCQVIGGDVTALVNYFLGNGVISYCPDYPPCPY